MTTTIIAAERERYTAARAFFDQIINQPKYKHLLAIVRQEASTSSTIALCRTIFVCGMAFQRLPNESLSCIDNYVAGTEAPEACTAWLHGAHHASLTKFPLFYDYFASSGESIAEREPDHSEDFARHELFAVFRAGARYAASNSPFRNDKNWSIPPAATV